MGDHLVLLAEAVGRGKGSGIRVTSSYAVVLTLRDGGVIREQYFTDHAYALEAVGLRD
jgi:ketosteroid isomerase-like protein